MLEKLARGKNVLAREANLPDLVNIFLKEAQECDREFAKNCEEPAREAYLHIQQQFYETIYELEGAKK